MVSVREIECEACGNLIEGNRVCIAGKYYHRSCIKPIDNRERDKDFIDLIGFNPYIKSA